MCQMHTALAWVLPSAQIFPFCLAGKSQFSTSRLPGRRLTTTRAGEAGSDRQRLQKTRAGEAGPMEGDDAIVQPKVEMVKHLRVFM